MIKLLQRHFDEFIMIAAELLIVILLLLQFPFVIEIITICVGLLSILCGVYCIRSYYHTMPSTWRYEPELRRGIVLLLTGTIIASMKLWFSITTRAPAVVFGFTLLTVALFKSSVVHDARVASLSHLLLPVLSAVFTLALSLFSLFTPAALLATRWICIGALMMFVLLVDAYEVYLSEAQNREPWSMHIRCWM